MADPVRPCQHQYPKPDPFPPSDYLQGLTYWRSLPGQANARAALVYGGDASYLRQGIAVLSWQHWE